MLDDGADAADGNRPSALKHGRPHVGTGSRQLAEAEAHQGAELADEYVDRPHVQLKLAQRADLAGEVVRHQVDHDGDRPVPEAGEERSHGFQRRRVVVLEYVPGDPGEADVVRLDQVRHPVPFPGLDLAHHLLGRARDEPPPPGEGGDRDDVGASDRRPQQASGGEALPGEGTGEQVAGRVGADGGGDQRDQAGHGRQRVGE